MQPTYLVPSSPDLGLLHHYREVRALSETLCAPLSPEDMILSATPETSPPKWHLAHTTWFFENFILKAHEKNYSPHHSRFDFLFNSYYESVGSFLPKKERALISRPNVSEVFDYRHSVDERLHAVLKSASSDDRMKILPILEIGIHHEQQHQELLLMDIKRNFFASPIFPVYQANLPAIHSDSESISPEWQAVTGGLIEIGNNGETFHYDNETSRHQVWIEPFYLSSHLVNNREFLEFVESGAYQNPKYWLSDAWEWIKNNQIRHPLYWLSLESGWREMTLGGLLPLSLETPVSHVSYYEAQAYANWKGCRLPTEFEWEHAGSLSSVHSNFLETKNFHPESRIKKHELDSFPDMHGDLWEWTQSAYLPYPRYQPYRDHLAEYNSKFMCNQFVLRGGSCVTPESHYRKTYRNFYAPAMRWQFSGIRLAKNQ